MCQSWENGRIISGLQCSSKTPFNSPMKLVIRAEWWRSRSIDREILTFMRAPAMRARDQEQQWKLPCDIVADIRLLWDSTIGLARFMLSERGQSSSWSMHYGFLTCRNRGGSRCPFWNIRLYSRHCVFISIIALFCLRCWCLLQFDWPISTHHQSIHQFDRISPRIQSGKRLHTAIILEKMYSRPSVRPSVITAPPVALIGVYCVLRYNRGVQALILGNRRFLRL